MRVCVCCCCSSEEIEALVIVSLGEEEEEGGGEDVDVYREQESVSSAAVPQIETTNRKRTISRKAACNEKRRWGPGHDGRKSMWKLGGDELISCPRFFFVLSRFAVGLGAPLDQVGVAHATEPCRYLSRIRILAATAVNRQIPSGTY